MRISDWSSDVCSSDLVFGQQLQFVVAHQRVALNQRMTDRADVLLEPGTGQFTRGNAAARLVFAFDDQRLYARFGEIAADDQRIVASARDHDFVGIVHMPSPLLYFGYRSTSLRNDQIGRAHV